MFDKLLSFLGFKVTPHVYRVNFENGPSLYYLAKSVKDAERKLLKECQTLSFEGFAEEYANHRYTVTRYD